MDKLTRDVVRCALEYIAEEMGVVLKKAAFSPNIRDRLDYSCVVATCDGRLVAQAEHIPVHLGSMVYGVRRTLEEVGWALDEGDVVIVNDPYVAGTHLNDIMLLKPVYAGGACAAIVACKAHHVDVGGRYPGGLGLARSLYEEGVVIEPVKLVKRGVLDEKLLEDIAGATRMPSVFKADILAQLAALRVGESRVREVAEKYGVRIFREILEGIIEYTEAYARARVARLYNAVLRREASASDVVELLSGGEAVIRVRLVVHRERLTVDFEGTSRQVEEPLNAVYGVTLAASTFVVKAMLDPEMPVNYGFYRVVEVRAPQGTIVNPVKPAPVGAGNLETAQRIVDAVQKAFAEIAPSRTPAASGGTMGNVVLAGRGWVFYETIGCGSGARPDSDGVDGVHVNMTNTLNTPVEVIESEYPVMIERYELREDSCGLGAFRGGLGIRRVYRALEEMTAVVVVSRRRSRPWGVAGGEPGAPARVYIIRGNGSTEDVNLVVKLEPGDRLVVETPGGGGYGDPCRRRCELLEADVESGKVSLSRYCSLCGCSPSLYLERQRAKSNPASARLSARSM